MEVRHPMGINSKHFGHSWGHFLPSQAGHSPSSGHTHLPWPGRLWKSSHLKLFCCCISPTFSYTLALSSLILKWNQDLESHQSHLRQEKKNQSYYTHHKIQGQLILLDLFPEESPGQQGRFRGNSASFEVSADETEQLKSESRTELTLDTLGLGCRGGEGSDPHSSGPITNI